MRPFIDPLDEFERIARNQPHPGIDKSYPKVTDGTTSSIIQKTPRRIVQQIPTGSVKGEGWLPIVAGFIFRSEIIPNANEQNAFIDKCWRLIRSALGFGAAHSYTPIVNRGDYFGPDLGIPYIKNVKFQAGKLSDLESQCVFLEAWYQPSDIDHIISKEKKLAKSAKQRGEKADSSWDLEALKEIKDMVSAKADEEKSVNDGKAKDDTHKGGVKLVHAFERGVGSTFYTFHPSSQKIVRKKKNPDPRGDIPVQTMYFETDGINPLGRGIVEQVGSLQNLMDSEMQMYQYNRALMLNPPLIKRGSFNKTQVKFVPNVIIDVGVDPNADVKPLTIDTSAIQNFAQNYGLMKSQLLNLTSSPDTSISSDVGNPGFSKTPAGVNAVQANVSVDDNYIRKQFEQWFERWAETAINLYFAEKTGIHEIQLDKETASKLRKMPEFQPGGAMDGSISPENVILVDFDEATEALKFEVDASTSNMKDNTQQLEALDALLTRIESSSILQSIIPPKKIIGAWNSIVHASGVENPEELEVSEEELEELEQQAMEQEQMAQEQMMAEQGMADQMQGMPPEMPIEQPMEVPEQPPEAQFTEEDIAFFTALQDMGYSDEKIMQADAMLQSGMGEEEVLEMLIATEESNG